MKNYLHAVDFAKLLGMPFMNTHNPLDIIGRLAKLLFPTVPAPTVAMKLQRHILSTRHRYTDIHSHKPIRSGKVEGGGKGAT